MAKFQIVLASTEPSAPRYSVEVRHENGNWTHGGRVFNSLLLAEKQAELLLLRGNHLHNIRILDLAN